MSQSAVILKSNPYGLVLNLEFRPARLRSCVKAVGRQSSGNPQGSLKMQSWRSPFEAGPLPKRTENAAGRRGGTKFPEYRWSVL